MNKIITEVTLSPIVPLLFCQVSHPPFKNPGPSTGVVNGNSVGQLKETASHVQRVQCKTKSQVNSQGGGDRSEAWVLETTFSQLAKRSRTSQIALQVVRTSFGFHLRECMGSCFPSPPPLVNSSPLERTVRDTV